jgi:MoaA/NifB/PqqE/SkfB family radical SAM enzyme
MSADLESSIARYQQSRAPGDRSSICHAPFVSLNFEQNGNVTACCYNRKFLLGKYPEDPVQSIWEGEKIRELRAALEKADFSKGCELCQEQMVSGNLNGMRARFFDGLRDDERSGLLTPKIVEFELGNTCNLECVMCSGYFSSSIRRNREKLPPLLSPYDDAFVEQIRPFLPGLVWAKYLGGEPFLNPLYFKLWEATVESGSAVKTVITTNATIVTDKIKRLMDKLKPYMVLSIDSLRRESYEKIRRNASYDEMRANLDYFLTYAKEQGRTVDIVVCPIRENWMDMPEIFDFATRNVLQLGINTVNWPLEVSLRSLPAGALADTAKWLRNASVFPAPESSSPVEWERIVYANNRRSYLSLVSQVEAWRDSALNAERSGAPAHA